MSNHNLPERDRVPLTRRTPTNDTAAGDVGTTPHPMLALQRQLGNAHIARMLAQRDEMPEEEDEQLQAKHDPSIAQRETPEEDELQAMHDHSIAQRDEMPEEEEEQLQAMHDSSIAQRHGSEDELQASPEVGLEGGPVSDQLADKINSSRGGGAPLDSGMRESMESSFGTSFEGVRVHTGSDSASLNHSISAKAFTTGSDIFLGQGASSSDQSLMAHELTHVVQQRSMSSSGSMQVGPAGDSYEQEADSTASAITAGQSAPQRKPEEK